MQQYARACEQSPACNVPRIRHSGARYLALLDRLDKEPGCPMPFWTLAGARQAARDARR
jgi:hypothetical protein